MDCRRLPREAPASTRVPCPDALDRTSRRRSEGVETPPSGAKQRTRASRASLRLGGGETMRKAGLLSSIYDAFKRVMSIGAIILNHTAPYVVPLGAAFFFVGPFTAVRARK
eukprot:scaffold922_cov327-Pinguiococcus_pyrenoidosus.AAC.11